MTRPSWMKTDPAPAEPLRQTGIPLTGAMPWGSHICLFYETVHDVLDAGAAFLRAGLAGNECCVWAVPEPIPLGRAREILRDAVPGFERHVEAGRLELVSGRDWHRGDEGFDFRNFADGLHDKLEEALACGFEGMRITGDAFWFGGDALKELGGHKCDMGSELTGRKMICMCTYRLGDASAADILDVIRAHRITVALRNGRWEFMQSPEPGGAGRSNRPLEIPFTPLPGQDELTPRERTVLDQIVEGATSREAARALGISPRTVDFHRANIMAKLGAKNTAELVRIVLGR